MDRLNKIGGKIKKIAFCTILIMTSCFRDGQAQLIFDLEQTEEMQFPDSPFEAFEDAKGDLKIEDILKPENQKKFTLVSKLPDLPGNEKYSWIRLMIKTPKKDKRWVLEIQSLHTPEVDFYVPMADGSYLKKQAGHSRRYNEKQDYKVKNIVFELPPVKADVNTYYLRIKSYSVKTFLYKIHPSDIFISYTVNEYMLLGIYYGILLIIAVYNLILFITNKETVFLLYVVYVISCILNSLTEDGLGFQYLWPTIPAWNIYINYYVAPLLFLFSFIIYSRKFLELNRRFKKLDKVLLGVMATYLFLYILSLIIPGYTFSHLIYFIPFATIYLISIYTYVQGYKPARFYILGYSVICLSILVNILRIFSILSPSIYTVYSFNIGLIIEACVMSFALGDKFRIIKEEKEIAQKKVIEELEKNKILQEKVNRELEEKVKDRTLQLQQANTELIRLSDELQDMNSKLDYDNWHLKRKMDEEKQISIVSKVVSFEEFKSGFPNEIACQKYIESLKWKDDLYSCRKCANTKFLFLQKNSSRKCTKCNYIESVTAYTLYHGVRFPLVKAFYITHLVLNDIKDVNIADLMERLDLSKNTCWKFRKKVEERMNERKKNKKQISNWGELIMDV